MIREYIQKWQTAWLNCYHCNVGLRNRLLGPNLCDPYGIKYDSGSTDETRNDLHTVC